MIPHRGLVPVSVSLISDFVLTHDSSLSPCDLPDNSAVQPLRISWAAHFTLHLFSPVTVNTVEYVSVSGRRRYSRNLRVCSRASLSLPNDRANRGLAISNLSSHC